MCVIILTEYAQPSETTGLNLCVEVSIVRDLVPFFSPLWCNLHPGCLIAWMSLTLIIAFIFVSVNQNSHYVHFVISC